MFHISPEWTSPHLFEPPDPSRRQNKNRSKRHIGESDSLTRKNILIVEDEALVAENLREFIEHVGYRVTAVFATGEEAVQKIAETPVDLILMDVRLAGLMSGIATVHLIHQTIKQVPVIFMSAFAEDLFPDISTIAPSLYRYVSKPYKEEELESMIREMLD